ncbi:hypothetical protein FQN57_007302 [Myotisia sp. PD_48]|nr:hypothetical protein FQN57_007302 [Myotisia sp. PD_48]
MSSNMYYYRPSTPPAAYPVWDELPASVNSSLTSSGSSRYKSSAKSSPDTVITNQTTPCRSPVVRQHGPILLPKIRPQDIVIEPASNSTPFRHRRVLSTNRNPPGYAPYPVSRPPQRRPTIETFDCSLESPVSAVGTPLFGPQIGSTLPSPITPAPLSSRRFPQGHSRSNSTSSIDEATLRRYGYPTYRQVPKYVSQYPTTPLSATSFTYPPIYPPTSDPYASYAPPSAGLISPAEFYPYPALVSPAPPVPNPRASYRPTVHTSAPTSDSHYDASTTLLESLTAPTQPMSLVPSVTIPANRINQAHFWWDIRNIRQWTSFSLETINSIPGLTKLLTTEIPKDRIPSVSVAPHRLYPESEAALSDLVRDLYAPRVNAALRISQGRDCMSLYPAPINPAQGDLEPHFLANHASDTEQTASGFPRGRAVGIVKSYERWNTSMRKEQPHRRVEYLNGLSHLHRCMREHSCRYGFIITEIELVCVRVGCDEGGNVPYFGYLEVAAPIALNTSSATNTTTGGVNLSRTYSNQSNQSSDYSSSSRGSSPAHQLGCAGDLTGPFTATLALYYLLMLSKSVPLPTQPSWHLDVGGPGAMTRQRVLQDERDKWIPDPQQREKREAKRIRGWVWPQDGWHRREGGGAHRSRAGKIAAATRWGNR